MPEESRENKAKKLAAARKKLKEYQQRSASTGPNAISSYTYPDYSTNSGPVSSNTSERSESELQLNGSANDINHTEVSEGTEAEAVILEKDSPLLETPNCFIMHHIEPNKCNDIKPAESTFPEGTHNINAIQVLITEKSQLTTELNKFRTLCREKELEIEEMKVQHSNSSKRVDELTQRLVDLQKQQEQQRLHNAELQHKLAQARAQQEDHTNHVNELQKQLTLRDESLKQVQTDFKDKCNELELSQLRVRQLSDENNITKDNRVETLTQTQFMYEQQIRDLQAMVQQLNEDKEQANTQYQTYVQQLNVQVQQLNERNNDLTDETTKLQEREKQWVDHIQELEKEIQRNISRQTEGKDQKQKESSNEILNEQLQILQERINEFDSERYEFQLKIKSQEDRLNSLQHELKQKDAEILHLKEHLENIAFDHPDKTKLLATMESDKVAASRALTQNVELKKQLDELELRFVQLTNDKADLVNRLDAEQFANREMQTNYATMEERLKNIDERFKYKDEEMIRLSHENEELKKNLENKKKNYCNKDNKDADIDHHSHKNCDNYEHDHKQYDNSKDYESVHHSERCSNNVNYDEYGLKETHYENNYSVERESCVEAIEENSSISTMLEPQVNQNTSRKGITPNIATEEAVEKLEKRFTQLMSQCADLTEEKQRLEHLVTQLQSETETIGEYITLYQTQRRILKQREYERAAQTAMLQAEREQMRERLTMLNNLVNTLSTELPEDKKVRQEITNSYSQNVQIDDSKSYNENIQHVNNSDLVYQSPQTPPNDLKAPGSQQILHKIQDIISEIKENTKELQTETDSVDHLNCCSGKFEVV